MIIDCTHLNFCVQYSLKKLGVLGKENYDIIVVIFLIGVIKIGISMQMFDIFVKN